MRAVKQGMKGQAMQDVMGNKNQMASLEALAQRRDHFIIQILKMGLCCLYERSFKLKIRLEMQSSHRKLKPHATQ